eukprot:Sspe_Gene.46106::Locus_22953_Transcript_1_1_Confidence_1.000_Length_975::g.46106::m.46106
MPPRRKWLYLCAAVCWGLVWTVFIIPPFSLTSQPRRPATDSHRLDDWSIVRGALSAGDDIRVANMSLDMARAWCLGEAMCVGFTFREGGDGLVFFKATASHNTDRTWASYIVRKRADTVPYLGKAIFTLPGGKSLTVDISSTKAIAMASCRPSGAFSRAERVPPGFGVGGFWGPPYALLQGHMALPKDIPCMAAAKPAARHTPPSVLTKHSLCLIKEDGQTTHFMFTLADHTEWNGQFPVLGRLRDDPQSLSTLDSIMVLPYRNTTWGSTVRSGVAESPLAQKVQTLVDEV